MGKVITSFVLSLVTIPTLFLLLPLFIFPPIALILGIKAAVSEQAKSHKSHPLKFAGWLAAAFAVCVFGLGIWLFTTQYKA